MNLLSWMLVRTTPLHNRTENGITKKCSRRLLEKYYIRDEPAAYIEVMSYYGHTLNSYSLLARTGSRQKRIVSS